MPIQNEIKKFRTDHIKAISDVFVRILKKAIQCKQTLKCVRKSEK